MENLLRVGVIASAHGIRGEVNVFPTTDDATRYKTLKEVLLCTVGGRHFQNGESVQTVHVEQVKFFKNMVIVKFKEFSDRNAVEPLKGVELYVTRENAVPLAEDEYFICDIIGAKVYEDTGDYVGTLEDVLETGANDVYLVKTDEGKELLFPCIKDCVKSVDTEQKKVVIHWMPGL